MKSAEEIFKGHWNLSTGKEADETTIRHMTWVLNAMEEYASMRLSEKDKEIEKYKVAIEGSAMIREKNFALESELEAVKKDNLEWESAGKTQKKWYDELKCQADKMAEALERSKNAIDSVKGECRESVERRLLDVIRRSDEALASYKQTLK